jgi:hypothetical protein
VGDVVGADRGGDGEDRFLGAPVTGRGTGAAAKFLTEGLLGRLGDGEADPARCPGTGQRVAPAPARAVVAASSAATLVLMRVLGLAKRTATASMAASPASIRAARAAASRAALLLECTQITR